TLLAVDDGKSARMVLDVLVRGQHEVEGAADRSLAASFGSGRALSASPGFRHSNHPLCWFESFDHMCCPLARAHPSKGLMNETEVTPTAVHLHGPQRPRVEVEAQRVAEHRQG